MENFALISLAAELETAARGMVVRRIVQYSDRGFLLETRTGRTPGLKLSMDPRNPVLYISGARPPVDRTGSDFLLTLRKHLSSARLIDIHKPLSERIVELRFRTALPARELETVTLVAELFPNAPNLVLLDSGRHILASMATRAGRGLEPFGAYRYPATDKTDMAAIEAGTSWFPEEAYARFRRGWLVRYLAGACPVLAAELVHRQDRSGQSLPDVLEALLAELSAPSATAWLYSAAPLAVLLERNDLNALRRAVASPIELESLRATHSLSTYPGMLAAVRALHDVLDERTHLERLKAPRLRVLRGLRRRAERRRERLLERQRQFQDAVGLGETAALLVSSGVAMNTRRRSVDATDYTRTPPATRTVELDPARTVRENIDAMFRKQRKAVRGLGIIDERLVELDRAEARLADDEERVRALSDWNAWHAFADGSRSRPSPGADSPRRPTAARDSRKLRARSVVVHGHEVLIGRNGRENDDLTFRVAAGDDFWLHAADYSGSHVVVRNPTKRSAMDAPLLERAAQLAAYHSQARNAHTVGVHYTQRKFVRKPSRAKPGRVVLRQFRTIQVAPRDWDGVET